MTVFLLNFLHNLIEFMHLAGPQYKINMRRPFDELVAFLLRHTTGNAENQLRILTFEILYLTDFTVNLILSRFPDSTGIDDQQISLCHIRIISQPFITDIFQLADHALRISHIHLTAVYNTFNVLMHFSIYYLHAWHFNPS